MGCWRLEGNTQDSTVALVCSPGSYGALREGLSMGQILAYKREPEDITVRDSTNRIPPDKWGNSTVMQSLG